MVKYYTKRTTKIRREYLAYSLIRIRFEEMNSALAFKPCPCQKKDDSPKAKNHMRNSALHTTCIHYKSL
jgi:hypothetical protein